MSLEESEQQDEQDGPVYIFGFGSLVHRPGFEYEEKIEAS
jgi:cation transport regulator ChaC